MEEPRQRKAGPCSYLLMLRRGKEERPGRKGRNTAPLRSGWKGLSQRSESHFLIGGGLGAVPNSKPAEVAGLHFIPHSPTQGQICCFVSVTHVLVKILCKLLIWVGVTKIKNSPKVIQNKDLLI